LDWLFATLESLRAAGCTVVMSAHGQNEALALARRALWLDKGALMRDSGPNGDVRSLCLEAGVYAPPRGMN
jgi:ABC-type cobalamin transport system ATPase subunit